MPRICSRPEDRNVGLQATGLPQHFLLTKAVRCREATMTLLARRSRFPVVKVNDSAPRQPKSFLRDPNWRCSMQKTLDQLNGSNKKPMGKNFGNTGPGR